MQTTLQPETIDSIDDIPQSRHWGAKRFNIALYRLTHGIGSSREELSILTGLSSKAIKERVSRARHTYSDDELKPSSDGPLDEDDANYLRRYYGRSKDPEVRDFIASLKPSRN